ncbi:MAG: hypothetical protein KIT57_05080 [Blastocatellales bacterium]|nr:hypothetical protein [Blastocatellales bacterium]
MAISIEHLLNIPGIRVLSVNYDEKKIECQIESTRGYSICHKCGRKASDLHEHEKELNCGICRYVAGKGSPAAPKPLSRLAAA